MKPPFAGGNGGRRKLHIGDDERAPNASVTAFKTGDRVPVV